MAYYQLIDHAKNHNKFWSITDPVRDGSGGYSFECSWGRHGTEGQAKKFWFTTRGEAEYNRGLRIGKKLREGYFGHNPYPQRHGILTNAEELQKRGRGEPHVVSAPSTPEQVEQSDHAVIRRNTLQPMPWLLEATRHCQRGDLRFVRMLGPNAIWEDDESMYLLDVLGTRLLNVVPAPSYGSIPAQWEKAHRRSSVDTTNTVVSFDPDDTSMFELE